MPTFTIPLNKILNGKAPIEGTNLFVVQFRYLAVVSGAEDIDVYLQSSPPIGEAIDLLNLRTWDFGALVNGFVLTTNATSTTPLVLAVDIEPIQGPAVPQTVVTISGPVEVSGGTVNIGNVPTVEISSSGNTVQISNTVTVIVSGPVTVTGTVNIGNNPTVLISGSGNTVQVSNTVTVTFTNTTIAVTGTVNIGNSPTVSISSSGNTVQVSNTVTVTFTNTTIAVTGTVNIGNNPTVLISGSGNTVQVSNTVTVTVSGTVNISGSVSISSGSVNIGTVTGTVNITGTSTEIGLVGGTVASESSVSVPNNTLTTIITINGSGRVLSLTVVCNSTTTTGQINILIDGNSVDSFGDTGSTNQFNPVIVTTFAAFATQNSYRSFQAFIPYQFLSSFKISIFQSSGGSIEYTVFVRYETSV
jgi:hypothetical protein